MLRTCVTLAAIGACVLAAPAGAQTDAKYPARAVRLLIPYAPGGATDIVARLVGAKLSEAWGQAVVVENRPGGSGAIALEATARAAPDGYTLMVGNVSTNAITPVAFDQQLNVKPLKELVPVAMVVEIPHIVAATPSLPANSLSELIGYARANPDKLNYASAGNGSYPHLDMVNFARRAGFEAVHVPYKGGAAQMLTSVSTGETQMVFVNLASALPFVKAGRMKVLATTWPERLAELPNVPTLKESGFPDVGTNAWNGFFAPSATPRPVLLQLNKALYDALERQDLRDAYAKQLMMAPPRRSLEELNDYVNAEAARWQRIIREGNVKVE
jgi:tripartite-type tricarboxylate transporter receptor subunit TctC